MYIIFRTCDLLVEPQDEPDLRNALAENENVKKMMALPATADSPILIHYDHKLAGEAATNPKQRVPPFKDWHQAKCLRAWMFHRGGPEAADSLHPADEYVLYDGGKPGLLRELTKLFKEKTHDVRHVTVMYKRDDIHARREKTRQGSVNQIEAKVHITAAIMDRPVRVGKHFGSSSDGNAIGFVRLPAWGAPEVLMLTPAEKALLFGSRRWEVGGPGRLEGEDVQAKKKVKWSDNTADSEPAFFHSPCVEFYEDELSLSGALAVLDFTIGQGYFLFACVMREIPSVGICMSQAQLDMAYAHMVGMCLTAMSTEGNDMYDARLCEVLGAHGETAAAVSKAAAAAKATAGRGIGGKPGKGKGRGRGSGGKPGRGKGRSGGGDEASAAAGSGGEDDEGEGEGELDDAEAAAAAPGSASADSQPAKAAAPTGASTTAAEQRLMAKLAAMTGAPAAAE